MNFPLSTFLIIMMLALIPSTIATVESINYPAANDIISETHRIKLDVTSDASSTDCWFSYNKVKNVSVNCNGTSLVNLPNADGTYQLTVIDDLGSNVIQNVTVVKEESIMSVAILFSSIIVMIISVFMILVIIHDIATLNFTFKKLALCYALAFTYLILYQLCLEYMNLPSLMQWLDMFLQFIGWGLFILSTIAYIISFFYQLTTKKKNVIDNDKGGKLW